MGREVKVIEALQILLTFVQAIMVVAIPAYFVLRQKRVERETAVSIAEIENSDDVISAQAKAQIEYAQAYRLLSEDAKKSIIEAKQAKEEMRQLREYVRNLETRIAELEADGKRKDKELTDAKRQIADLQDGQKKKDSEIKNLRQRLARIKGELDTGSLHIDE